MSQTIIERTGDSKWYIKGTDAGECPEIAGAMVNWALGNFDSDDED